MSTATKILVGLLALFGLAVGVYLLLGILHWLVIGAVVIGVGYVGYKAISYGTSRKPKSLRASGDPFAMNLKSFDLEGLDAKSRKR